ncbi:MAG: SDR family NAD(P)-dependent oxidoreductase [Deltaproteobacteria bacterium]|nr:SDR family NAD(P)-dependent oxidoreductase [Deltaproteobacteria bacterium]
MSKKKLDRSAVITGAGSGLGRALALELGKRGYRLLVSDLDVATASETAELARKAGAPVAESLVCDVRELAQLARLQETAARLFTHTDLLVNNAGVAVGGPFLKQTLDDWRWIVDINLFGVLHGVHAFLPAMQERGQGHILNIASAAGLLSPPQMVGYNATKAAVVALSETLGAELAGTKVGVTVACPTFFKTAILANARIKDEEARDFAEKMFGFSRATAEDVARACVRAVHRRDLYVVPNFDGKLLWNAKRMMPTSFLTRLLPLARRLILNSGENKKGSAG